MKYIILTENQIKSVINHAINERLGVPDNLINTSHTIYNMIVNEIPKLDFNNPEDSDEEDGEITNIYKFTIDGNFDIHGQKFNKVNFILDIRLFNHPELKAPEMISMTHYSESSPINFKKIKKIQSEVVTIGGSFIAPLNWRGPMSQLSNILFEEKDNISSRSSFAHELMHSYGEYKNPTETVKSRINYSSVQNFRLGIRPIDELFHYMYYIHNIENAVKPVEVASEMKRENITKTNFKEFIKRNHTFVKLDKLRKLTINDLLQDIKSNMNSINKIIGQPDFPSPELKNATDDDKIREFLRLSYVSFINHKGNQMAQALMSNFIEKALGPDVFPPDKKNFFYGFMNSAARFKNNPIDFYKYEIKNINQKAEQQYRKISKLYDYEY